MNKPFKVRVWDKQRKKMFADYLTSVNLFGGSGTLSVSGRDEEDTKEWTLMIPDEAVLMEFTGLLDKNDKEIYDGDILRFTAKIRTAAHPLSVVFFQDNRARWALEVVGKTIVGTHGQQKEYVSLEESRLKDYQNNGYYEVIGNIYENPELLHSQTATSTNS